jgi:hypothetical protein
MTLVVSLRVLDGVILAADSLSTLSSQVRLKDDQEVDCKACGSRVMVSDIYDGARSIKKCPACEEAIEVPIAKPLPFTTPSSTLSYAQKVFPFLDVYGVAVFGASAVNQKTVYNHLKGFEQKLRKEIELQTRTVSGVQGVATLIRDFCQIEFDKQYPLEQRSTMQEGVFFGLQVVGYDGDESSVAKTIEMTFGSKTEMNTYSELGIHASGDTRLIVPMALLCKQIGLEPVIGALSLQDAVDYAEFLIQSTMGVQRFANMIPTVGGEIDIALITNYTHFRWIKAKALARMIEPTTFQQTL